MTKEPERPVEPSDVERASLPATTLHYLEYLEAAEQDALALVAVEREVWAMEILTHIAAYKAIRQKGAYPPLNESFINTIRARTQDDTIAALERVKQEARNEALRKASRLAGMTDDLAAKRILALITEG